MELSLVRGPCLSYAPSFTQILLLLGLGVACQGGVMPDAMIGTCQGVCVPNIPEFPCIYTPTYPVLFFEDGTFRWEAPYANGTTTELGQGQVLSAIHKRQEDDGSWTASWYGGNRSRRKNTDGTPADNSKEQTHCACYFVKGTGGQGKPFLLSNYPISDPEHSFGKTIEEVCRPYYDQCQPYLGKSNETAWQHFGAPWIEAYPTGCQAEIVLYS